MTMPGAARPLRVAILVLPETSASVAHAMFDLFISVGRDWELLVDGAPGVQPFAPQLVALQPGPLSVANGLQVLPHAVVGEGPPPDIVCLPEVAIVPREPVAGRFDAAVDWLRRCHDQGAVIAASCSGTLLLAETGLLEGREAATHWAYFDALAESHPGIRVNRRRTLVITGEGQRLVMAGGAISHLHLSLYLIARFAGADAAVRMARLYLIDWHAVAQQPFAVVASTRQVDDAVITRCQQWVARHYDAPAPVAAMVQLSGLGERTFSRRFKQATGLSPIDYVHTLRIEEAKQALESGDTPVEAIAAEVGYEDTSFFNRLFRRHVQLTPAQYRKRFGALRKGLLQA